MQLLQEIDRRTREIPVENGMVGIKEDGGHTHLELAEWGGEITKV